MGDVLYIVIPAYNEAANISKLIEEWYPIIEKHNGEGKSRMVIVDDGSSDNTGEIVKKEAHKRPQLRLLKKENGGHGSAVLTGYRYAIKSKADYIFQTDSDRQTLPEEFEGFWSQRKRFDAIIGERSQRQDGIGRIIVTDGLKLVLLLLFRRYIPDANAPYRLMKRSALRDALSYIERGETLPNVMIAAIFAKERRRVLYKKISFRARQGGKNSLNVKKILIMGTDSLQRFVRMDRRLS